jgi:ubiquinone/menaquinone biosynthesis C-methylase UbiE
MNKNYDRYAGITAEQYDKKTIMSYFCRIPADRKLLPILEGIKNSNILDVGLGTGRYTQLLTTQNRVTGIDTNPHLCKLPITVHKGDAGDISRLVGSEKFDVVLSTWMTEYLNCDQLRAFFEESKKVLAERGRLMTTMISKYGFGFLYVAAAKLIRSIDKYNYKQKKVVNMLEDTGFCDIEIINLYSWLYVPWAYLVVAQ